MLRTISKEFSVLSSLQWIGSTRKLAKKHVKCCLIFQVDKFIHAKNSYRKFSTDRQLPKFSDDMKRFDSVWPGVKNELTEFVKRFDAGHIAVNWFDKALEYNVPKGKKTRGLTTVVAHRMLAKNPTEAEIHLAHILGWTVEMAFLLMVDDTMDGSTHRRGQPTWYTLDGVGMLVLNDSIMILSSIFNLLESHFADKPYHPKLVKAFNDTLLCTTIGQSLDVQMTRNNVLTFTMEKYDSLSVNKTFYYTFQLPVALALIMTGNDDPTLLRKSDEILLEISRFFQIQDDYLDVFGDPKVTGKDGTDIQDNKCSWFAAKCVERANEQQKEILSECYGVQEADKVARVKELYRELKLVEVYRTYEKESHEKILKLIDSTREIPSEIFLMLMGKLYGRKS